jgi:hypothetical protein
MPQKEVQQVKKQHAVPQNIMSVEFKLIGDMTVRQFFYVATGGILALIFFKSNLPFIVRWVFTIVCGILGAAMAFVPLEERGLDVWITSFFKVLGKSTQMVWRKDPNPPAYFLSDYARLITADIVAVTPIKSRARLYEYIEKIKREDLDDPYEINKRRFLESLNFNPVEEAKIVAPTEFQSIKTAVIEKPLSQEELEFIPKSQVPDNPVFREAPAFKDALLIPKIQNIRSNRPIRNISLEREIILPRYEQPKKEVLQKDTTYQKSAIDKNKVDELNNAVSKLKEKITVNKNDYKNITENHKPKGVINIGRIRDALRKRESVKVQTTARIKDQEPIPQYTPPTQSVDSAPKINIIKGCVLDKNGKLLDGALILVKDAKGDPERALKTNSLGEFYTVTPLDNGDYSLETKYHGLEFDVINFKAEGRFIERLVIKAK